MIMRHDFGFAIPIKADGTFDEKAPSLLVDVGKWMDINESAIDGSRPWSVSGEGFGVIRPHDKKSKLKSSGIRFFASRLPLVVKSMMTRERAKRLASNTR